VTAVDLSLRTSCLVARAQSCVAGFEKLGQKFSADLTRQMVNSLECGAPGALYEHWVGEQEKRLAGLEARHG
jgi:hypothetical protein